MFDFWMIVQLMGGLGLFLYGMKLMSDSLTALAGDKLRDSLSKLTSNRFAAVGVGAGVTAIIQSSSATSVMVIGFVNAGIMNLVQAINVCMGAHIGTTITAQIIAINVTQYAPIILFVGVVMMSFVKRNRQVRRFGGVIAGLGFIFFGMSTMSGAMAPLRDNPQFIDLLASCKDPLIGVLVGLVTTSIVQSSSAMVGIVQAFAMQNILGLDTSVFLILGINIGACMAGILAALGGTKTAMRAAIGILVCNIIGTFLFIPLCLFTPIVSWVESWTSGSPVNQLANFHTLYNCLTTVFFLCFPKILPFLATKLVPGEDKHLDGRRLVYLADPLPTSPTIVVDLASKETARLMSIATQNVEDSVEAFLNADESLATRVNENEQTVNHLSRDITSILTTVSGRHLSPADTQLVTQLLHTVINVERISDLADNIGVLAIRRSEAASKGELSEKGRQDLDVIFKRVDESLHDVVKMLNGEEPLRSGETAMALESEIDNLEKRAKKQHIKRLKKGECTATSSMLYTDCITTLERVSDHSANIASVFLRDEDI